MNFETHKYQECIPCSKKPGSPILCQPCLENRKSIEKANNDIHVMTQRLNLIQSVIALD